MKLADDLERLCCAETEAKFFDYVTESIGEIIARLREGERLRISLIKATASLDSISTVAQAYSRDRSMIVGPLFDGVDQQRAPEKTK